MSSRPIRWNTSPSGMLLAMARPRWAETRQGLTVTQVGYACLLVLVTPSMILLRLGAAGTFLSRRSAVTTEQALTLGLILVITGGILAYGLILAGQWRCLMTTAQGHGAKESLFASLVCLLTVPLCVAAVYFLGSPVLRRGFQPDDLLRGSGPICLGGVFLLLLSVILFSCFLRATARCLKEDHRGRAVTAFLWFLAFLLGGTVGTCLDAGRFVRKDLWLLLGLGWVACLLWHVLLIRSTSRFIVETLSRRRGLSGIGRPVEVEEGQVKLRVAELLRKPKE
jgi:hypothetical protein